MEEEGRGQHRPPKGRGAGPSLRAPGLLRPLWALEGLSLPAITSSSLPLLGCSPTSYLQCWGWDTGSCGYH